MFNLIYFFVQKLVCNSAWRFYCLQSRVACCRSGPQGSTGSRTVLFLKHCTTLPSFRRVCAFVCEFTKASQRKLIKKSRCLSVFLTSKTLPSFMGPSRISLTLSGSLVMIPFMLTLSRVSTGTCTSPGQK